MRKELLLFALLFFSRSLYAQQQNFPGGSATSGAVGPVINVTNLPYSASPSLADNATAFTAAFTAAASVPSTGTPSYKNSSANTAFIASGNSVSIPITIAVGDCVIVWPNVGASGRTLTISDNGSGGGNLYVQTNPQINPSSFGSILAAYTTPAPRCATVTATQVTITISGAATAVGGMVAAFNNIGSYRFINGVTSGGTPTTAPAISQGTGYNNAIIAAGIGWYSGGTTTASANVGTIQTNSGSTVSLDGGAIVTNTSATPASVSASATLSGTSGWEVLALELDGVSQTEPTVYIPYGYYYYSSGLSLSVPQTLRCELGTVLYYIGSAHAVDVGPSGLAQGTSLQHPPYIVDGCAFMGGQSATHGVYLNAEINTVGIRNSYFLDFGNSNTCDIAGAGDNWDVEIGPQNRFQVDNGITKKAYVCSNVTGLNNNSFFRVHDNQAWCISDNASPWQYSTCVAAHSFPYVLLDGSENRVYHNNMMFGNPAIQFICTNTPCYGNQSDQNQIEAPSDAGTACVLKFGGTQNSMLFTQNVVNMHSNTSGVICPVGGSDVLTGARVNFNTVSNQPAASPFVKLNNVANQTANYSYSNNCSASLSNSTFLPCPLIHTAGGSITQWNADNFPVLAFAASTTATYNFSQTYSVVPTCTIPPNIAGTATTLTITTLSTTQIVITASASNSSTVHAVCSAGDGQ